MRTKTVIFVLLFAFIFVMADTSLPLFKENDNGRAQNDSLSVGDTVSSDSVPADSTDKSGEPDTTNMDSLQLAIYHHNKQVDDSIRLDSINRKKSGALDAPVTFSSEDSMVYDAKSKVARLYGNSNVKYQNMDLSSDRIQMSLDSSLVRATGTADSTGAISGTPVFTMGQDKYESDTMAFNFKTKKGFIYNVYTEQEDGYLSSQHSKRDSSGVLYLEHGRYTTCDQPHPDFYIALSRAKVRPGKDVVFGPAYLVVADVPLPLAIPYGFFPFTKSYSSGFIMPSYGDESSRGFYLRDGGYYFAMSDKWDLKLLGEIYTKGSWGLSVASNYRKRYRYNGSFFFSYQNTKNGDKGMPDYTEQTSFKLQWSHRQDTKSNPFSSLSASVNFASTSYERNNLNSMYNPQSYTQSLRTSSVNWSTSFSSLGMTISGSANLSQNMIDSTVSLTLPDLNISVSRFYPFKRKHMAGKERWYEKISMSYTGQFSNSIDTKEDKLFKSNLIKDWRNAFQHNIPINANFTLFNYININPSFNFTDRMYSNKVMKSWDEQAQTERADTTYGFYNVYNWSMSIGASTKMYGFWVPSKKIFGDKIQAIRHVLTPQVTFSYAPDCGSRYYETYQKTDADGNVSLVEYSPFENGLFNVPSRGKTGSVTFDLSNNIEMKVKSDKDSTGYKKLSIIDELGFNMGYNMAAKEKPWSDLTVRLRLKWWKNYTFNLNAVFATYAYELDDNGRPYVSNHTEYSKGRFGRFQGLSQNISFTLNPEKLKKWFGGGDDEEDATEDDNNTEDDDTGIESNVDDDMVNGQNGARKKNAGKAETDADGYMKFSMPWSLTFGYGITMRENTSGKFNTKTMRYPYAFTQTLNFSGNIRISDGWNISFSSGYDFENHDLSMTTASLSRDLHCFNMSCSVVLAPYTSYNFSFRCNAATLTDALKYDKRSGYSNAVQWY
ncbi:putative LPS assembly protein LptD [Prevotella marseillensis]|jgi:lipopolysaccharide assembly outer membrane protein LptD (OstA)|uniref:putative LPS assembly protein LptD n=1 Tax=Prevotella marseillensis TaxID=2479840 RepID=UPI000F632857|nr:putative LPS assembly protein LptD [Prevotella marseillensis]HJH77983.1 putative LPS assembly protein LptD [Prevotellaceae bacterium]